MLISVTPSQTDLNHIIFGNILGVSQGDLLQICVLAVDRLRACCSCKHRDLTLYAFDPLHAQAIGLSPDASAALLLGLLALTSVVALQVVGVILVVAMLIVPGATAHLLTDRFSRMLLIAPVDLGGLVRGGDPAELLARCLLRAASSCSSRAACSPSSTSSSRGGACWAGSSPRADVAREAGALRTPPSRAPQSRTLRRAGHDAEEVAESPVTATQTELVADRPSEMLAAAPVTATSIASENGAPGRTSSTVPTPMPCSAKNVSSRGSSSEIRST